MSKFKFLGGLMFCVGTIMAFYFGMYMGIRSWFEPVPLSSGFFCLFGIGIMFVGACILDSDYTEWSERKRAQKKLKTKIKIVDKPKKRTKEKLKQISKKEIFTIKVEKAEQFKELSEKIAVSSTTLTDKALLKQEDVDSNKLLEKELPEIPEALKISQEFYCPFCWSQLSATSAYCFSCGVKVETKKRIGKIKEVEVNK